MRPTLSDTTNKEYLFLPRATTAYNKSHITSSTNEQHRSELKDILTTKSVDTYQDVVNRVEMEKKEVSKIKEQPASKISQQGTQVLYPPLGDDSMKVSVSSTSSLEKTCHDTCCTSSPEERLMKLSCRYCGKNYNHKSSLSRHIRDTHESMRGTVQCQLCTER